MYINKFLEKLGITRVELSNALGMKNPSSLGRYKYFEDLKKIKNIEYIDNLSFLFNVKSLEKEKIDIDSILNDEKNIKLFNERLHFLKERNEKKDNLKNLEVENKKLLYQNISIIENIMISQDEYINKSLNILLKMLERKDEKIEIFLLYLGKMNMEVNVTDYNIKEPSKQKELEALLFLILNDKLRTQEIEGKFDIDEIYKKFSDRVEIRKEIFEEQKNKNI